MAYSEDKTIDGLDALTSLDDTDVLIAGDQSDSDRAKKITKANFKTDINNISAANATDLTDSGESTLHYHNSDRARANHTGTQTASTISDFDTEVANNSAVTANTAKVTNATHTGEVTGSDALAIADNVVDEANLKLDEAPTNDYVLTADSTKSGGMKWAASSGGAPEGTAVLSTGETGAVKFLREDGDGTCSWQVPSGAGDVVGPASSTDGVPALFNGTTGKLLKNSTPTGTGNPVLATSPTLVTPNLGTPSAGVLTNCDNATDSAKGVVELATTAETNTGTDATRAVTPDGLADSKFGTSSLVSSINFIIDGGGSAITTGIKGYIEIPFACTINQVTLLSDQSGSIVVDIWKDTYANYPPTDADSITSSTPPTITTATKSQDSTLTSWTTSISAGDILGFNVDSITTVERVTISLKVTRT